MISILLFLVSIAFAVHIPVNCPVTAPYNLNDAVTVLSVYNTAERAQSRYIYNVRFLIENYNILPPIKREAALDRLISEFCEQKHFKGFIGITGDGTKFTDLSAVKELYRGEASKDGVHVPFAIKGHNGIPFIVPESQVGPNVVYVNLTSLNEHQIRAASQIAPNQTDLMFVTGHYQNEFRINRKGKVCISAFHDDFLTANIVPHIPFLEKSWNLPIDH